MTPRHPRSETGKEPILAITTATLGQASRRRHPHAISEFGIDKGRQVS